ncbi:hypothetical protein ACFT5B_05790 [Luteimicrobium sp. NPDC057192]|uniref:hypothetical protein n=1 Tax=Luteimicrobium sp. NPDC057192 TaxID=3346042 RepID=UPI00363AAD06
MADVSWLVTGTRSGRPIVVAPGGADPSDAVVRVDAALDGFAGPVPRWYRATEQIGYWWVAIWVVLAVAVTLTTSPASLPWRIASGMTIGLLVTPISLALYRLVARAQARAAGAGSTDEALRRAADRARPSTPDSARQVAAVLAADPRSERRVHDLAWRAAKPDPAARKELEGLWEKADPERAALAKRQVAQLQAELDQLKADGKA